MPLQKSFSEQSASTRTRQRWHKSKSNSAVPQSDSSTPLNRRPLDPISETTKNKLNAFNFRPVTDKTQDESHSAPNTDENVNIFQETKMGNNRVAEVSTPIAASKNNSTSTPVSRLAWQDLIGTSEVKEDEEDVSPNERIGWDARDKDKLNPMYKMSPMMASRRKGKKRARSSSPTSSPARQTTPAINVKKLSAALKSPHPDPALELWDRFALSGSASAVPAGANNPALANIMMSSSPQPSRVLGAVPGEAGLRRAISCGANWPKRRRVERNESTMSMQTMIEESPIGSSKSSMVNALLKSVTGEIEKSDSVGLTRRTTSEPSESPSPSKIRPNPVTAALGSPTPHRSPKKPAHLISSDAIDTSSNCTDAAPRKDSLSDYGDDDFDDDTLMGLDADLGLAQAHTPTTPQKSDTIKAPKSPQQQQADQSLDDDEFAELDDEMFAVADGLVSQIDSIRGANQDHDAIPTPIAEKCAAPAAAIEDLGEDLYGDDFGGDFDFEAAEMAATQSVNTTNGSVPLVRR
ncbi:hypothetical protein F5Y15DRAFT_100876 [Xylariaceae sp. FL0016]|nr:hypothetical protein F5Y15DRAFT_100876 [Xylariaceae sp. FL0016]